MDDASFRTVDGPSLTAVTAAEMRDIDRVATEDVGVELLQMMENAGRNLAARVRSFTAEGSVLVLAGGGGNGGGGLACVRHLHNHGVAVSVVLDRPPSALDGAAAAQHAILDRAGVPVLEDAPAVTGAPDPSGAPDSPVLLVDAIVGYGLEGEPRDSAADLIEYAIDANVPTLSLDVPSGRNATTGDEPGVAVTPEETLTLALPKTGLGGLSGRLTLGDIAIPSIVYESLSIPYEPPFGGTYCVEIEPTNG